MSKISKNTYFTSSFPICLQVAEALKTKGGRYKEAGFLDHLMSDSPSARNIFSGLQGNEKVRLIVLSC